jgi:hypothetical protein
MKNGSIRSLRTMLVTPLLALEICLALSPKMFAQGSLTPPGPPKASMLSLAQVEPRIPISSAPFTITSSGSYFLTTNVAVSSGNAITITAIGVTLDLKGFTISSTAAGGAGYGIYLLDATNVHILNGNISGNITQNGGTYSGNGFAYGINHSGGLYNARVSGLSVFGCRDAGINLETDAATVVESSTVYSVGGAGIVADSVANSVAYFCGTTGISANTVNNCYGQASQDGISSVTAINCYGYSTATNGEDGLYAYDASDCYGISYAGYGLEVRYTAQNCAGYSVNSTGLNAFSQALNCYGEGGAGGDGMDVEGNALNCSGISDDFGVGLNVTGTAQNCYAFTDTGPNSLVASDAENSYSITDGSGTSLNANTAIGCTGYSAGGIGVNAYGNAQSCIGISQSGFGMYAFNAQNCFGYTIGSSPYGLYVAYCAQNCTGTNGGGSGDYGLYSQNIAIGCYGLCAKGTGLGANIANSCNGNSVNAANKYNMP